jgi:hypothetical protein
LYRTGHRPPPSTTSRMRSDAAIKRSQPAAFQIRDIPAHGPGLELVDEERVKSFIGISASLQITCIFYSGSLLQRRQVPPC